MGVMKIETMRVVWATLLLLGTIIGAGIFGVPAMIGAWGVIPSTIAMTVLTCVLIVVHLYYGEAIIQSRQKGHLIGRATYWLGPWSGKLAGAIQSLQIFGSCLAYLILGGMFLSWIGASLQLPLLAWQCLFWAFGALVVLYGLKAVASVEAVLTWALIGVVVVIGFVFVARTNTDIFWVIPETWNGFGPYGVFLFSLIGIVGMPEAAEVVEYKSDSFKKAIVFSTIIAAILTYFYGVTAWMASDGQLTDDVSSVVLYLPIGIGFMVPLFGFLAVMTSFIASALDLRNLLEKDARASKTMSWLVALGVPLILLLITPRNFLSTIGFVGSFFGAGIATIVVWMGVSAMRRTRKKEKSGTMFWRTVFIPWLITILFAVAGILWLVFPSSL